MSKQMNLPQIQRILQDFEKESSMMDMKEEMMSDSIDDVMEDEGEGEEVEGDRILEEVLAEIGISVGQQVSSRLLLSRIRIKLTCRMDLSSPCSSAMRRPCPHLRRCLNLDRRWRFRWELEAAARLRRSIRCRRGWTI